MDGPEKNIKMCYVVIAALALVIIGMLVYRSWNCNCSSRSGYEDVRNLPVYQGNQVVNGLIGNAQRMPGNFV